MLVKAELERAFHVQSCLAVVRAAAQSTMDPVARDALLRLVADYEALSAFFWPSVRFH